MANGITHLLKWLLESWHLLTLSGIVIASLGALYSGYSLFRRDFLNTFTQRFVFGVTGGLVIGLGLGFVGALSELLSELIQVIFNEKYSVLLFPSFQLIVGLTFAGVAFGITFGSFIGFDLSKAFHDRALDYRDNWSLLSLCSGLISLLLLLVIPLGWETSLLTFIILCPLIYILVLQPWRWSTNSPPASSPATFFRRVNRATIFWLLFQELSWWRYVLWHILGGTLGLILGLLVNLFFGFPASLVGLVAGLLIGTVLGQPMKILKRPKVQLRVHPKKGETSSSNPIYEPTVNWPRFSYGFAVGFVDGLFIFGLLSGFLSAIFTHADNQLLLGLVNGMVIGCIGGIGTGFIVGSIYGLGPAIAARLGNLSATALGSIGLTLTVLGIVLAALPSLLS